MDHAISYGVFYYLETEENAEMALKEMLRYQYTVSVIEYLMTRNIRITKPSGTLYIGDVDDPVQLFRETNNGCW